MAYTNNATCPPIGVAGYAASPSGLPGIVAGVIERIGRTIEVLSNRRAILRLSKLDEDRLADMGVTREDIEVVLLLPWHIDPSDALNDRLRERRR